MMEALVSSAVRASFYPTLAYNILLHRLGLRQWYTRIDDTVILGALPYNARILKELRETERVTGVVSVVADHELSWCGELLATETSRLHLPVPDLTHSLTAPQIRLGIRFIQQQQGSVYVHCKAGRTRSATLVCCYLMGRHGWTPERAERFVRSRRPHVVLRAPHWASLRRFYVDTQPPRSRVAPQHVETKD